MIENISELLEDVVLSDRSKRLVKNCITYKFFDPAGLPGHNLMLIVNDFMEFLSFIRSLIGEDRYKSLVKKYRYGDDLVGSFDPPYDEWWERLFDDNTSNS